MIELGRFFSRPWDAETSNQMDAVAKSISSNCALLAGPPQSGKTSLLLQYAVNCAQDPGARVVFICQQRRLEVHPPRIPKGLQLTADVFRRIQIRYLETDADLRKYFSFFHCLPLKPRLVVIDDFFEFFSHGGRGNADRGQFARERDMAFAKTLAYAFDAVSQTSGAGQDCELVVSDTTVRNADFNCEQPRLQFLYSLWLPLLFHIHGVEDRRFKLVLSSIDQGQPVPLAAANYSLNNNIQLEGLEL